MDEKYLYISNFTNGIVGNFPFVNRRVAEFIACQFALESNFGRSDLAVKYNNHCGMKLPYSRLTTAKNIDSNDVYAHYNDIYECLVDYFFLMQFNKVGRNMFRRIDSFKIALRQIGYCPEQSYISRIESIFNTFINS